jgi:two-component system alkaline phosphatase synthesis response regulator PhoP
MAVVLVVNDDADMLDIYESVLISMGHQPVTKMIVSSGPATVREVGADALVVDLQQPDENEYGVRIIREVRADPQTSDVPIILCTGAAEAVRPLMPQLDALGVPIVIKPFAVQDLETTLRDALKKRREH